MTIIASMSFFVSHKFNRKKFFKTMRSWFLTRSISKTISKNRENNVNLFFRFLFWKIQFDHFLRCLMMMSTNWSSTFSISFNSKSSILSINSKKCWNNIFICVFVVIFQWIFWFCWFNMFFQIFTNSKFTIKQWWTFNTKWIDN